MKRQFILTCICLLFYLCRHTRENDFHTYYYIYRWKRSDALERHSSGSFLLRCKLYYPFAHAYRALGYLGVDRKAAIDKDVYHLSRLGFNAYRIHLWDVELTDGEGNLSENDHLDLMDYLIAKLKERNIHIVITAQTNFGNGYPERNEPTSGFSYKLRQMQHALRTGSYCRTRKISL